MDPVSHILLGAAIGKSFRAPRPHFWTLAVLAECSDLDIFFRPLALLYNPIFFHRSWTHSLAFSGGLGLLIWGVMSRVSLWGFAKGLASYLLVALSHPLSDWMTSYGTPLLWPWSEHHFSLDWISNLSLGPLLILGAGLCLSKIWRSRNRSVLLAMWMTVALFIGGSIVLRRQALALVKGENSVDALPDLINPLIWKVIVKDSRAWECRVSEAWPLSGEVEFLGAYPIPVESVWLNASRKDPQVKLFLKSDRWPIARVTPHEKGATVEWGNLLFMWGRRVRGKLIVDLDGRARVLSTRRLFETWDI